MANPALGRAVYYNQKDPKSGVINSRWWKSPENEKYRDIFAIVKRIRMNQSKRNDRLAFLASLYENEDITSFSPGAYDLRKTTGPQGWQQKKSRLTVNVIKASVDTLVSRIGTKKPRPMAVTDDAQYDLRERAKKFTSYFEGLYDDIGMWREGRLMLRDACVLGTGILKLSSMNGKIVVDRILCNELVVDETEAAYGKPRSKYQCRYVAKDVVRGWIHGMEDGAKKAKLLKAVEDADSGLDRGVPNAVESDMILVIEAYHLKSWEDAKDGRHVISIETADIVDEVWERPYFPFVYMRYTDRMMGFYGRGLTEETVGVQLEMNKLLRTIAQALNLIAVPQVWLEHATKVVKESISNEIGGVRYYVGHPPVYITPTAMNPEAYQQFERLYRLAFEIPGLSQLSAHGQTPAGMTAGKALRTMQDIESDRFKWTQQKYDEVYLDGARIIVDMLEDLQKDDKAPSVKVKKGEGINVVKWADVRIDLEKMDIRLFPTSMLPSTPEGRYQQVQEMIEGGFIDKDDGIELLDYPDIRAVTSRKLSPRLITLKILSKMIEDGEYISPEPYMDLALAKKLTQLTYLQAQVQNVPSARLDLILTFMADIDALEDEAAQQEAEAVQNALPAAPDPNAGMPPDMAMDGATPMPAEMPPENMLPPAA